MRVPPSAFLIVWKLAISCTSLAQGFSEIARISEPSVCRVEGSLVGSGFVFERDDQVVTTLHLVAGVNTARVTCASSSATPFVSGSARVEKVLRAADLALLRLERRSRLIPLTSTVLKPLRDADLLALGYSLNTLYVQPRPLKAALLRNSLTELVDQRTRYQLQGIGIDVNQPILHLNGPLVPGLSGAPILDSTGKVVGVGDGGLERGAASISWAVPVARVAELIRSREAPPAASPPAVKALFSAESTKMISEQVIPGEFHLARVRTRTLPQLSEGCDDPYVLNYLLGSIRTGLPNLNPESLSFDVYQDAASGALVVVPSGLTVEKGRDSLRVIAASGSIEMRVKLEKAADASGVGALSERLERTAIADPKSPEWFADTGWTMPEPSVRDDGVVFRRKGFMRLHFGDQTEYLWETLAARGNVIIGAFAHRTASASVVNSNPQLLKEWARIIVAVHLTTFAQ